MSTREDNIVMASPEFETKRTETKLPETKLTNYEAMQKLSCKFADFIESTGVKFDELATALDVLRKPDPAAKILIIKAIILPQLDGWQDKARAEAKRRSIAITEEQITKVGAYLKAFVEIANA